MDATDRTHNAINARIDRCITEPGIDARGQPLHRRRVTAGPGLYFPGLPGLHTSAAGERAAACPLTGGVKQSLRGSPASAPTQT